MANTPYKAPVNQTNKRFILAPHNANMMFLQYAFRRKSQGLSYNNAISLPLVLFPIKISNPLESQTYSKVRRD